MRTTTVRNAVLRKFSLRATLIGPFLPQILITTGLVGLIVFESGQQSINAVASQLRNELTTRISEKLNSLAEIPHAINSLNASAVREGDIDIPNVKGVQALWQQLQTYPDLSYIHCGDEHGATMGVGRFSEKDRSQLQLQFSNASTQFNRQYYQLDNEGNRKAQVGGAPKPYDPRTRSWYKEAKTAGRPVWSDIHLDTATNLPTVDASIPIYSKTDGSFIGVFAADLFLPQELSSFLQTLKIGKTGTAFIVERSGLLVATSTSEPMLQGSGSKADRLPAHSSGNPAIQGAASYLDQRFPDLKQIQSVQQIDFMLNGERQYVQVAPFQNRNLDWLIVLTVPESDFMGQINAGRRNALWLSLAALLLAAVIGILASGWVTRPIQRITSASEDMARGELDQHIPSSPITELDRLGNSFNGMAGQLKESFETLEERVRERTAELATANEAIAGLNQRLQSENVRMAAELDVLREMQQLILPRQGELDSIRQLDIAGYMEPADEVGGDYYDVLQRDGHVKIGIGDVTGHGLESGMLMLMTQTAVRTLQESNETDPTRFLDILNRTIYGNVERIRADRSLTLAMIDYSEGVLRVSGQHEEVIVVRRGGAVERVDTLSLGFPIGLEEHISEFISQKEVKLDAGDGAVLYTDGITEAMNSERKMYGLERLCDIVSSHWNLDVDGIRQAVIDDVRQHIGSQKVFDDITLVVLKQK